MEHFPTPPTAHNVVISHDLTSTLPQSKIHLLRSLVSNNQNRIMTYVDRPKAHRTLETLKQFSDIFLSSGTHSLIFTDFDLAFDYGKRAAQRFGFSLRTKTSSYNQNHGVQYKYLCCSREGQASVSTEAAAAILTQSNSRKTRESNRCGCPYVCRLIGIELQKMTIEFTQLTSLPTGAQCQPRPGYDYYERVWYFDSYDKCGPHNHALKDPTTGQEVTQSPPNPVSEISTSQQQQQQQQEEEVLMSPSVRSQALANQGSVGIPTPLSSGHHSTAESLVSPASSTVPVRALKNVAVGASAAPVSLSSSFKKSEEQAPKRARIQSPYLTNLYRFHWQNHRQMDGEMRAQAQTGALPAVAIEPFVAVDMDAQGSGGTVRRQWLGSFDVIPGRKSE